MTDEYIARERALSLAHADAYGALPVEDILALAEKYLAFLMPDNRYWTGTALRPLHHGGIAG